MRWHSVAQAFWPVRFLRYFRAAVNTAVLVLAMAFTGQLHAQTLRSIIPADTQPDPKVLANLDRDISNYAILNDAKWFAVAYYLQGSSDLLEGPLFVDRYDRAARQWRSTSLAPEKIQAGLSECKGSAQSLKAEADSFVLETHVGPDASCTIILSTDLQLRAALYGLPLKSFLDGSVVFLRGQEYYGPVHVAEIDFYNHKSGHTYALYPRKPAGPVR